MTIAIKVRREVERSSSLMHANELPRYIGFILLKGSVHPSAKDSHKVTLI